MTNLQNFDVNASKFASNYFTEHKTSKEWKFTIIATIGLKILASIVSVFAGYKFFNNFLYPFVGSDFFTSFFSVLFLLVIEVMTITFIAKSFKYGFKIRKDWKPLIFTGIVTIFLFGVSFVVSTKGIAMWRSEKVDESVLITDNHNLDKQNTAAYYDNRIEEINAEIALLKGHTWKGRLSTKILNEIKDYNDQISDLRQQRKSDLLALNTQKAQNLSLNKSETTSEASKYYLFVAIVMFFQLFTQFLVAYFAFKIFKEEEPEKLKNEHINHMQRKIKSNVDKFMLASFTSAYHQQAKEFALGGTDVQDVEELKVEEVEEPEEDPDPTFDFDPTKTPYVDEFIPKSEEDNTIEVDFELINAEPKTNSAKNPNRGKIFLNQKICKQCGDSFVHNHKKQIFCSNDCRDIWHKEKKRNEKNVHVAAG